MSLAAGTRLGPYEIQAAIGAGGMGEVYKARDTRLDRTVAIKVLPAELSADPERRARFEREARAVAALSHPHICTLHDIGTHEGTTYLVMEHLPGQTLADRLLKGPLPVAQALDIAARIADALDAAHKHGIVHRDLKPGNVMLTTSGTGRSGLTSAKLLDFGLAKLARHGERPALVSETHAVTAAAPVTARGTILGTLQYMAPEQLEGREADARTDLWALGAILYEMVTGRRAFSGDSEVSLIGNIMNAEPPSLARLQPLTPPSLERVVQKCLAKHPDDRWDTAHDLADELRWIVEVGAAASTAGPQPRRRHVLRALALGLGAVALAVSAALAGWLAARSAPGAPPAVMRSYIDVRPAERVEGKPGQTPAGSRTALAITQDGKRLVFVGRVAGVSQLYVRPLNSTAATGLSGTDGAESPVFSPDGRWIAFWAAGRLKKVQADGGPVTSICRTDSEFPPFGLSWGDDGRIVFGMMRGGLMQVPSDGGTPTQLTKLGTGEVSHGLPHMLPGSEWLLFTVRKTVWLWGAEQIVAQSLTTEERKVVMVGGTDVRYVPTGHLVYLQLGTLTARAFDAKTQRVTGPAVGLVERIAQSIGGNSESDVTGAGQYAVSATGTLLYLPGGVASPNSSELVVVDRRGRVSRLPGEAAPFRNAALAPDGRTASATTQDPAQFGLWLVDLPRGTKARIVSEGEIFWPIWAPDGRRVAFLWREGGTMAVAWVTVGSAGTPERLTTTDASGSLAPVSWLPGGRLLAVAVLQPDGSRDISTLSLDDPSRQLRPLVHTQADETNAAFSPDGRWLAYASNETGRYEVYVQAYPAAGQRLVVSTAGGANPAWHPNGRELFYVSGPDKDNRRWLVSTNFTAQPQPAVSNARPLFEATFSPVRPGTAYGVFPDGERFLVVVPRSSPPPPPVTEINLVANWFEELKAKVPATR